MGSLNHLLIDIAIIVMFMVFRTPRGARRGNLITALAFAAALALVFVRNDIGHPVLIALAIAAGGVLGWYVSVKVTMTRTPALIALQNGAGGGASLLVSSVELTARAAEMGALNTAFAYSGVLIGAVALSGSVLAALKLENRIDPRPRTYTGHNWILLALLAVFATGVVIAGPLEGAERASVILLIGATALVFGVVFSMRIGGADMPVLISFLNTLSGLAAACVGVALGNQMLIAAGAMVGSSGLILTWVMCTAMNRNLVGVLTGNPLTTQAKRRMRVGADAPAVDAAPTPEQPVPDDPGDSGAAEVPPAERAVTALTNAESVIIVPGYGMALAHAQFDVARLASVLEQAGKKVRFAVHPVAGRMPGHMHVLLAEADVDYDKLFEMDSINDDFGSTDVALVVGASDVVNPAAIAAEDTPISGMPILRVHEARAVIVCNLDDRPGYSGVPNPLYGDSKTIALFGDAKDSVGGLITAL